MTKQEEAREGVQSVIRLFAEVNHTTYPDLAMAINILGKLHSQGVVIKGDKGNDLTGCCIARLEPLIKE